MRSRRSQLEADGATRACAAPRSRCDQLDDINEYISACQVGITLTSIGIGALGEPALADLLEPRARRACSPRRRRSRSAVIIAYADHHVAAHHGRRAWCPKFYAIDARRGRRPPRRAAAARCSARVFHPFIVVLNGGLQPDPAAARRRPEQTRGARAAPRRSSSCSSPSRCQGGQLDPGEAGMLTRRLPPARAGGAPGDDADPGGRHRRRLRGRRDGAAPLRLRPATRGWSSPRTTNPDRVRGHRPRQRARPAADRRRAPHASIEPLVQRRADRPRDQAARRPARRPPAPAHRRWRWSSTSTAASRASSPSRTSSRRSSARSTTRPTRPAARCAGWPTATGSCAATSPITDLVDYGLELPVDTDAYNSVGGFVFAELGPAAAARRHRHRQRLLDPRRVGAREPHRGGAHPRAPRGQRLTGAARTVDWTQVRAGLRYVSDPHNRRRPARAAGG